MRKIKILLIEDEYYYSVIEELNEKLGSNSFEISLGTDMFTCWKNINKWTRTWIPDICLIDLRLKKYDKNKNNIIKEEENEFENWLKELISNNIDSDYVDEGGIIIWATIFKKIGYIPTCWFTAQVYLQKYYIFKNTGLIKFCGKTFLVSPQGQEDNDSNILDEMLEEVQIKEIKKCYTRNAQKIIEEILNLNKNYIDDIENKLSLLYEYNLNDWTFKSLFPNYCVKISKEMKNENIDAIKRYLGELERKFFKPDLSYLLSSVFNQGGIDVLLHVSHVNYTYSFFNNEKKINSIEEAKDEAIEQIRYLLNRFPFDDERIKLLNWKNKNIQFTKNVLEEIIKNRINEENINILRQIRNNIRVSINDINNIIDDIIGNIEFINEQEKIIDDIYNYGLPFFPLITFKNVITSICDEEKVSAKSTVCKGDIKKKIINSDKINYKFIFKFNGQGFKGFPNNKALKSYSNSGLELFFRLFIITKGNDGGDAIYEYQNERAFKLEKSILDNGNEFKLGENEGTWYIFDINAAKTRMVMA